MAEMKIIDYDDEYDSLFLRKQGRYKGSVEVEGLRDVIIDFSQENVPIGIEILDASKILNLPKTFLSNLDGAAFGISGKGDRSFIVMLLKAARTQERVTIPVSVKN